MISNVAVRNFQSLYDINLDLEPFTVVVGPSSSGKSAFVRALKTLIGNSRGSSFISQGEKICTIQATTDAGTVVLKRGRAASDNEYVLVPAGPEAVQSTFTKLGGETPEEVSQFLGIKPKDSLHFASQLDKPYLLDDSANEVARTLGALTNVNVIFEAARESNRRKLAHVVSRRTRADDLEDIKSRVEVYKPLKSQLEAIGEAEEAITVARGTEKRLERLVALVDTVEIATASVERTKEAASIDIPSLKDYEEAAGRLERFMNLLNTIAEAGGVIKSAQKQLEAFKDQEAANEALYLELLKEAGTCPTCGQGTKELEHVH